MVEGFGIRKNEGTGFGLEGEIEVVGAAVLLEGRNFRVCSVSHSLLNTLTFMSQFIYFVHSI